MVGEIGYVSALSHHLPVMLDINQIPLGSPEVINSRPYFSQFPNLAAINEVQSVSNGHYNSMIGSLRTTNFHGFTSKLSYTLGHSIDDLSYARHIVPQNSYCLKCDYGNSDFDIRNSFSMFLSYAFPEPAQHRLLLGGWQLNTLWSFFTGTPFTVGSGIDSSGTGEFNDRAQVVGNPFANVPASNRAASTYYYFNPTAFAAPAQGTYGNEMRNQFYGPGTKQIDFSVFKNFSITEQVKLQFRAEIFNIFNFVDYSNAIGTNVQGSNLGQVGSTYDVNFGAPGIGPWSSAQHTVSVEVCVLRSPHSRSGLQRSCGRAAPSVSAKVTGFSGPISNRLSALGASGCSDFVRIASHPLIVGSPNAVVRRVALPRIRARADIQRVDRVNLPK